MRIIKTTTSSLRHAQVVVCVGCCCGRVDRGKSEVPIHELKSLWKNYGLRKKVQLTVSGCLGPCDMHNVALLMSDRGQIWLGNLRERAEFEALAEWAHEVIQKGAEARLPNILEPHRFERWETIESEHTLSEAPFANLFTTQPKMEGERC